MKNTSGRQRKLIKNSHRFQQRIAIAIQFSSVRRFDFTCVQGMCQTLMVAYARVCKCALRRHHFPPHLSFGFRSHIVMNKN